MPDACQGALVEGQFRGTMLSWILEYTQVIGTAINLGMLVVWIAYLQVFVSNYRRQTLAKILINRGAGRGLDARCLVSNMSSEAIYLQSIILDLEFPDEQRSCPVTELEDEEDWEEPSDEGFQSRQGPLGAGQVRDMGAFRAMLAHALGEDQRAGTETRSDMWDELRAFEIRIIAAYGSEDLPVGAMRRFEIVREKDGVELRPPSGEAQQIRSKRERKAIKKVLDEGVH